MRFMSAFVQGGIVGSPGNSIGVRKFNNLRVRCVLSLVPYSRIPVIKNKKSEEWFESKNLKLLSGHLSSTNKCLPINGPFALTLRCSQIFILGGKRRLRYQLYVCGKIYLAPRFRPKNLIYGQRLTKNIRLVELVHLI